MGEDRDEPGGESALRREHGLRAFGECLDFARALDVLGEIEVVRPASHRGSGNRGREMKGHRADHHLLAAEQIAKRSGVVESGADGRDAERLDRLESLRIVVGHGQGVVAGMMQQVRDGFADLAGAEEDQWGHGRSRAMRRVATQPRL